MMHRRFRAPDIRRRFITGFSVFGGLIASGTAGYMIIERWSFIDSLFMTVTTITTVGYREVRPLDTEGRIFTIFLVLFGVGTAFYLLTTLVALVIEGDLAAAFGVTRMKGRIEQLRDHHILCGFGRVGEEIAREFAERKLSFVVIESNPETVERAAREGYLLIEGDATSDEVLLEAGIHRARSLLAASDSDSGNTYITLTAKALNPNLFVVARAGRRDSETLARRAGADRVISPYLTSGRRMALSAIQPNIVDFVDTLAVGDPERILAELEVTEESGLVDLSIDDIFHATHVAVLGLQRISGELIVGPGPELHVGRGDRLMVVGPELELSRVSRAPEHAEKI